MTNTFADSKYPYQPNPNNNVIYPLIDNNVQKKITKQQMVDDFRNNELGSFLIKGDINIASDFPTLDIIKTGWIYIIKSDVIDNDITKTNTNQRFVVNDMIYWKKEGGWLLIGRQPQDVIEVFSVDDFGEIGLDGKYHLKAAIYNFHNHIYLLNPIDLEESGNAIVFKTNGYYIFNMIEKTQACFEITTNTSLFATLIYIIGLNPITFDPYYGKVLNPYLSTLNPNQVTIFNYFAFIGAEEVGTTHNYNILFHQGNIFQFGEGMIITNYIYFDFKAVGYEYGLNLINTKMLTLQGIIGKSFIIDNYFICQPNEKTFYIPPTITLSDENIIINNNKFLQDRVWFGDSMTQKDKRIKANGNTNLENSAKKVFDPIINNTTQTVITTINTPVKITAGWNNPLYQKLERFEFSTNGWYYRGFETTNLLIGFTGTILCIGANTNQIYTLTMRKNNIVIPYSSTNSTSASSTRGDNFSKFFLEEVKTNDYIEIYIENNTGANNLLVSSLNLVIL